MSGLRSLIFELPASSFGLRHSSLLETSLLPLRPPARLLNCVRIHQGGWFRHVRHAHDAHRPDATSEGHVIAHRCVPGSPTRYRRMPQPQVMRPWQFFDYEHEQYSRATKAFSPASAFFLCFLCDLLFVFRIELQRLSGFRLASISVPTKSEGTGREHSSSLICTHRKFAGPFSCLSWFITGKGTGGRRERRKTSAMRFSPRVCFFVIPSLALWIHFARSQVVVGAFRSMELTVENVGEFAVVQIAAREIGSCRIALRY